MSRFEIQHFFTMTDNDRRELRIRFPKKVRLGAALQPGCLLSFRFQNETFGLS
jgi:hypothetical protein